MRWIFRGIGALIVLVFLAVGALFLLPTDRIAALAADRISAAMGRSVEITGAVSPTLWPQLGVRAGGFSVGNPDWVEDGPLISAEALSVRVPWSAVFSGEVQIEDITLQSPRIILVRGEDGRESWSFGSNASADAGGNASDPEGGVESAEADDAVGFSLTSALVTDGSLLFVDRATDQRVEIAGLDAEVALPASGVALVSASARVNGMTLSATGEVDNVSAFLSGEVRDTALALSWDGGEVRFDGATSLRSVVDGRLQATVTDLAPLMALADQAAPEIPVGAGRDLIALTGDVTYTEDGTAHLRNAILRLDDNTVSAELDLLQGAERPLVRGSLRADTFSVAAASGSAPAPADGSTTGAAGGGATGWSTAPIDVSGLFIADLEVRLQLGRLSAGNMVVAPVNLRVTNTSGRAVTQIDQIGLYGGMLGGQLVVNGNGGLSVRTDLLLADVQLSPLSASLAGYDRLEGRGSASLAVLAVGNDMATLMRSLDGQGDLALGAGAIRGLDIGGMIRNRDASFQGEGARTVFDSLTANFDISGGVLQNGDLLMDAPWGGVTGAGAVDIGAQTLDYTLVPGVRRQDGDGAGLQVPILITGAWGRPLIRPDLEYLARQRLSDRSDDIEAGARDVINEALNMDLQEGDTTEDAREQLRERLREEARDGLRNLLGGN